MATNKLLAKMKKEKAFNEILQTEQRPDEWISTNCIPVNLIMSGKIRGGIKKGVVSEIAADSSLGKTIIGYSVLKAAQMQGMQCFILCSEKSVNWDLLTKIGVNMKEVGVFNTSRLQEIKQAFTKMMNACETRAECRNTFVLLDSWGTILEQQVLDKAEEGSTAVNMSGARFRSELANILLATDFTILVLNHVYATMQMYGDQLAPYGGKKLFFNCDAIMLATSVKKDKDKQGNLRGKIITAKAAKGRCAKENVATKYLIQYNGGVNPFYGLLDEAIACGAVVKPKNGYYVRNFEIIDPKTGEDLSDIDVVNPENKPKRLWKEDDLYTAEFWIPIYKNETFRKYVEEKFSFEDSDVITASQDVMAMMDGTMDIPRDEPNVAATVNENEELDFDDDIDEN